MDLNELTPELFEKAEFTERRRGYDIDQVERFLEETGTAVAQLLVRHRQLEERAAQAETRLAATEQQLEQASAAQAMPEPSAQSAADEAAEIEHATSTLLMAKRTADATIGEAEAEAAQIRSEAAAGAGRLVTEARVQAEAEMEAGRQEVLEVVTALEARRDALGAVVGGFEQRIGAYRDEIGSVAAALLSMAEDPEALGARSAATVLPAATGYAADDPSLGAPAGGRQATVGESDAVDLTDATAIHDTATAAREDTEWSQGSWSEAAAPQSALQPSVDVAPVEVAPVEVAPASADREPSVIVDAEPVTGQTSDRFLRELDEAVNESQKSPSEGEEAMTAFFEGDSEEQGRSRFGWRR